VVLVAWGALCPLRWALACQAWIALVTDGGPGLDGTPDRRSVDNGSTPSSTDQS